MTPEELYDPTFEDFPSRFYPLEHMPTFNAAREQTRQLVIQWSNGKHKPYADFISMLIANIVAKGTPSQLEEQWKSYVRRHGKHHP